MTSGFAEGLVNRLARTVSRRSSSRRGFLGGATLIGAAMAVDPIGFVFKPQSAYASVCGTDSECSDGYSAFCCSINDGQNTCPPGTYAGGWWKADRSSFCGGSARYYIDCNAKPGHHFPCHCNKGNCDHRLVACNVFRYGQCNTDVHGVTAVVCRQISCRPPWELYPGECGHSSATDNNTRGHTAPCLTKDNTFPPLKTFPAAQSVLTAGHSLHPGQRLTSPDRHTTCVMQSDGNLVIRNQRGVVWSTNTAGRAAGGSAHLFARGELVVLDRANHAIWSSDSAATSDPSTVLALRSSGQLKIVRGREPHLRTLWRSHTHTP